MVTENEEQVYQVFIYLTPHLDRVHMFQEMNPTLREAYEAVALAALTELCERHAADLDVAPVSYLPIHHQADGPWRVHLLGDPPPQTASGATASGKHSIDRTSRSRTRSECGSADRNG